MSFDVRAAVAIGPWGDDTADVDAWIAGGCPVPDDGRSPLDLPMLHGFFESRFNPLVARAMVGCLDTVSGKDFSSLGVVLSTVLGDTTTADRASAAVGARRRPQPVLFYQSVPTSVLGHVSTRYGITGPMLCVSGTSDLFEDAMESGELLLLEPDVTQILFIYVDIATEHRPHELLRLLTGLDGERPAPDYECCVAVLVGGRPEDGDLRAAGTAPALPAGVQLPRPLAGFLALAGAFSEIPAGRPAA
ncbi:hypothetical protein ACQP2P_15440 [Dactylosporangium sp. CA-139114]|uniref:hypothetical protein n=1 Tax=Dactylosporangium sp. CA-139114 TaxID=3239931 RepID=UPI003D980EBA